jgi:hypothetical protein
MGDSDRSAARLRSLRRLIKYSHEEALDLGLTDVAALLEIASTTVSRHKAAAAEPAQPKQRAVCADMIVDLGDFRRQTPK